MSIVDFMAVDDDHIPRKGETVVLTNLRLRADEDLPIDKQRVEQETAFVVIDVIHRLDAFHTIGNDVNAAGKRVYSDPSSADVEVWIALPETDRVWPGLKRKGDEA